VSSELSVAKVLANLEVQMTLHRESEAYHAQQEIFHCEQVFGPSWIAAEVNRRFSRALPKPLDVRLASAMPGSRISRRGDPDARRPREPAEPGAAGAALP
jgi:hypothetical protein